MKISDYNYDLPEELIAQFPPEVRGTTRLLVLNRTTGQIEHRHYADLAEYIKPGDLVILNDTKVIKARLLAQNAAGQVRELLLLENHADSDTHRHKVLYRGKLHAGEILKVQAAEITVEKLEDGGLAQISSPTNLLELADQAGSVPLPPYMHRQATAADTERYQTVFAREPGSVAAPTASLNFTDELAQKIRAKGGQIAYLTLHVGLGTFLPIRTGDVEDHHMHSEYFVIPAETVGAINAARQAGRRVIAVGTTVARTLEHVAERLATIPANAAHQKTAISGEANIFIYPGYKFKIVDGLLTNFHAPRSTVLMLTAAFAGWPHLEKAYQEATKQKYAFLSYGDSMFIA